MALWKTSFSWHVCCSGGNVIKLFFLRHRRRSGSKLECLSLLIRLCVEQWKHIWLCWLVYFLCVLSAVYQNRIVSYNYLITDHKFSYKWNTSIFLFSLSILIIVCKARSLPIEGGSCVGCSLTVKYFTSLRTCHWQTFFAYFDLSVTNSFCKIVTRPPGTKSYIVTHEKARQGVCPCQAFPS